MTELTTCNGIPIADEPVPSDLWISLAGLKSQDKKHFNLTYAPNIMLEQSNNSIQLLPHEAPQCDNATTGDQDRDKNTCNTLSLAQYLPVDMGSSHVSWPNLPTINEDGLNVYGKSSAEAEQTSFNGKREVLLTEKAPLTKAYAFEPDLRSGSCPEPPPRTRYLSKEGKGHSARVRIKDACISCRIGKRKVSPELRSPISALH